MKRSEVLKANQFRIVLNWVLFYHWEGKEISKSINRTIEHYREYVEGGNIEVDISIDEVKNRLKKLVEQYINNDTILERDINRDRKTYIKPSAKNIREFFEINELPFIKAEEYRMFLQNNVICEF